MGLGIDEHDLDALRKHDLHDIAVQYALAGFLRRELMMKHGFVCDATSLATAIRRYVIMLDARLVKPDGKTRPNPYYNRNYPERCCDFVSCGRKYRGPAVYCSLECALLDA